MRTGKCFKCRSPTQAFSCQHTIALGFSHQLCLQSISRIQRERCNFYPACYFECEFHCTLSPSSCREAAGVRVKSCPAETMIAISITANSPRLPIHHCHLAGHLYPMTPSHIPYVHLVIYIGRLCPRGRQAVSFAGRGLA